MSDKLIVKYLEKSDINRFSEKTSCYLLMQDLMLLAKYCIAEFCIEDKARIPSCIDSFNNSVGIQKIYD